MEKPLISVVTPLWNEEDLLPELAQRLGAVFEDAAVEWQWVAVDDGSSDHTAELATKLQRKFRNAKFVKLSKNFGQQGAFRAGLDHADGDAVIFLDADMQDPPEHMPELIGKWRGGAKLVVGCRKSRAERGIRGLLMNGFHEVFFRMTGGAMPKNSGTFGLMDRLIADQVRAMPERNLFLPALRKWVGFKQDVVWYDRKARAGEAKQTYTKLFRYAWDGITSFSETPLQIISALGAFLCLLGFGYAAFLLGIKFLQVLGYLQNLEVQGFTTLALAVVGLGGIQLLCLGVIGQYLARVYTEVKARPHYIVESLHTVKKEQNES